tara:strand:+ start:182 stop:631 length:450 start_codon:yes stop_codon:yes gene_type:complete
MKKKITIWFLFISILFTQLSSSEEEFLSLKNNKVNVRYGPGKNHAIKYIYNKKNLPIKQIDKKENWRRIIDLENNSGWIHDSQLRPSNSIIILQDKVLFKKPSNFSEPTARLEKGRLLIIQKCREDWCKVSTGDYTGWVKTVNVWGSFK